MVTILIVLTALLAKTQMQPPTVELQQINEMTISALVAQQKETARQAHKKLSKRFLAQQNSRIEKDNDWQLRGVVKTGGRYFALIKQRAKLERREVGYTLLDHGTIIAIDTNGISVRTTEQVEEYKLYKK